VQGCVCVRGVASVVGCMKERGLGGGELRGDGRCGRSCAEAGRDRQPQRLGGVVQAAALPLLRSLGHMDAAGLRVDSQHLEQAAMAGTSDNAHTPPR
jgi:hypothetical protein